MKDRDNNQTAEIIRAFLVKPLDKPSFEAFFSFCCSETLAYLRSLRAWGRPLPVDQVQQEQAEIDIAYDLLGPFLASRSEAPFYVIFDYFRRHGITDFANTDAHELLRHMRILLRGFVSKELTLIKGLASPQIKNLKRRFRDTLKDSKYATKSWPGQNQDFVFCRACGHRLRENRPTIPRDQLLTLVQDAFQTSTNRTTWCARIFDLLDKATEYCNALPLGDLIGVAVAVNAEFADVEGLSVGHLPTVSEAYLRRAIERKIEEALDWVREHLIDRLVAKGRLAAEDTAAVMKACRQYLEDLGQSGQSDSIPSYFIPLIPGLTQERYLAQYKYVLDQVMSGALEELRRRLRDDSTIWPFGSYTLDEGK